MALPGKVYRDYGGTEYVWVSEEGSLFVKTCQEGVLC